MNGPLNSRQQALVRLGEHLRAAGYRFVTPTPETHRRVNSRPRGARAGQVRDIFGWSRPFRRAELPDDLLALCDEAGILAPMTDDGARFVSTVRFSTLSPSFDGDGAYLFVHSAYPTVGGDAVFFGPDSYRFADFLARTVGKARRLVDIGCGTGVGGLVVATRADRVLLTDINPQALAFSAVNVALAQSGGRSGAGAATNVTVSHSDVLAQVTGPVDAVIANPPYLADEGGRLYRDGGGDLGIDLAARIIDEGLERLSAEGQLLVYTGTPVIDGENILATRVRRVLEARASSWHWQELDPDVFGEELDRPDYADVERIAVVALTATAA